MKDSKRFVVLVFIGLLVFGAYSNVMAEQRVQIEDQSIKALVEEVAQSFPTVTDGDYVTIAWTVKVRNKSDQPITKDITLALINQGDVVLDKATVTGKLDAGECASFSDTLRLRRGVAKRIASGYVAVVQ